MHQGEDLFAAFDGLAIYYRWWLPDDAAPKAVVLIVHGLAEHSGRYAHLGTELVEAGYGAYAVDHRGHGRSGGTRAHAKSYDEFMHDLVTFRALVEEAQPGAPLIVLGHSMGGNLAVGHTLEAQDGLAGLALSGPALKLGDDFSPAKVKVLRALAKVAPRVRPQALSPESISRDPAVVEAYRNDPLVFHGKASAGLGAAVVAAIESFPDRYDELTLPIWIGHGTDDLLTSIDGSREMADSAVNADVTTRFYDGLFHEIFNEPEREQVLADFIAWLDGLGLGGPPA